MQLSPTEAEFGPTNAARRPLTKLFACPREAEYLLSASSERIECVTGDIVFGQHGVCRGLYIVISGDFMRKAERMNVRFTLGPARAGDVVELAAALSDAPHTYTLSALTTGSVLLLPLPALHQACAIYPPLRMHLLEELAREVSRSYLAGCLSRMSRRKRSGDRTAE